MTPRSKARRTIARVSSDGCSPPKFCQRPSEIAGSWSPLRPQRSVAHPVVPVGGGLVRHSAIEYRNGVSIGFESRRDIGHVAAAEARLRSLVTTELPARVSLSRGNFEQDWDRLDTGEDVLLGRKPNRRSGGEGFRLKAANRRNDGCFRAFALRVRSRRQQSMQWTGKREDTSCEPVSRARGVGCLIRPVNAVRPRADDFFVDIPPRVTHGRRVACVLRPRTERKKPMRQVRVLILGGVMLVAAVAATSAFADDPERLQAFDRSLL